MANRDSYIGLDVGGVCYKTSVLTLTSFPESMLGKMFGEGGVPPQPDRNGNFFIDRDGRAFRYVLNFMRDKKLCLPPNFEEHDQLLAEADFFLLPELKKEILSRLNPKPVESEKTEEKWIVLLTTCFAKKTGYDEERYPVCLVEVPNRKTWQKLKSLNSAYLNSIPQRNIVGDVCKTSEMECDVYHGKYLRSILTYLNQDGFKLEGTTKLGDTESMLFTYVP